MSLNRFEQPILRKYRAIKKDPLAFFSEVQKKCGDFAQVDLPPYRYYLVNDPDLVREALVEKPNIFIIKGGVSRGLARLIGHGILTNRGEAWRESRRELQPHFNHDVLKNYAQTIPELVQTSIDRWKNNFAGQAFSINRELLALSIRITCSSLFSHLPSFDDALNCADAIWVLQSDGMNRHLQGIDLAPWLPLPLNFRVNRAKKSLYRLAHTCIDAGAKHSADEILSVLFAGTESPANTLCFALKLLEEHSEWRREEAISQVLSETMRLYPAGWAFERMACEDTTLGGEAIQKGSRFLFSPFLLHRNPRFWKDPEKFDPTRFVDGDLAPAGVHKYAYIPFGAGPRSCIGARMAWMEMSIILSMMMKQCRWKICTEEQALMPKGSFKIRLSRPMKMEISQ